MLGTYTKFYFSAKLIENLHDIHANPVKENWCPILATGRGVLGVTTPAATH